MTSKPEAPRRSLSSRVFATIFSIAMVIIVAFTVVGTGFIQGRLAELTRSELVNQLDVVSAALDGSDDEIAMLRHLKLQNARVTLVDTDGTVLYDSDESPAMLPNHKDRPEIEQAFETGSGSSERSSTTLGEVMLYEAKQLEDGRVVRLAQAQSGYVTVLLSVIGPIVCMAAVCIVALFLRPAASRAPSSSPCSKWTSTIPNATRRTSTPRWSPCSSASRRSARSSSAR